jgi:hypothetical protein
MKREFSEYTYIFFWDFKRMDNVNYNFTIVETLFNLKKECTEDHLLNKTIIIILASIIECIIYDFIRRVNEYRQELIPGIDVIDEAFVDDTRNKICDQFEPLIAHIKKHDLLGASEEDNVYQDLDFIRRLRNRIHIQNRQQQLDKDEPKILTNENVLLTSNLLEKICDVLCNSYPRPDRELISIVNFPRPWVQIS